MVLQHIAVVGFFGFGYAFVRGGMSPECRFAQQVAIAMHGQVAVICSSRIQERVERDWMRSLFELQTAYRRRQTLRGRRDIAEIGRQGSRGALRRRASVAAGARASTVDAADSEDAETATSRSLLTFASKPFTILISGSGGTKGFFGIAISADALRLALIQWIECANQQHHRKGLPNIVDPCLMNSQTSVAAAHGHKNVRQNQVQIGIGEFSNGSFAVGDRHDVNADVFSAPTSPSSECCWHCRRQRVCVAPGLLLGGRSGNGSPDAQKAR